MFLTPVGLSSTSCLSPSRGPPPQKHFEGSLSSVWDTGFPVVVAGLLPELKALPGLAQGVSRNPDPPGACASPLYLPAFLCCCFFMLGSINSALPQAHPWNSFCWCRKLQGLSPAGGPPRAAGLPRMPTGPGREAAWGVGGTRGRNLGFGGYCGILGSRAEACCCGEVSKSSRKVRYPTLCVQFP